MTDATNGEALLPCPFCGSKKTSLYEPTCHKDSEYNPIDRAFPLVRCASCWAEIHGDNWDHSGKSAIEAWNRRQPTASAGMVVVPRDVIDFLLGEGDIEGHGFGERHHALPGKFWWRSVLRDAMLAAHESQPTLSSSETYRNPNDSVSPPADTAADVSERGQSFDFRAHLQRQRDWSGETFGPGTRTAGVIDHIRKELCEIEADPADISEWIDVVILALDGAWRAGHSPDDIIAALQAKQAKNEARTWPDWRTMPTDKAIEHVRPTDNVEGE